MNGIANKNKFDGKWVNIIVAIAPIFYTSFAETTPLIPLTMLQKNRSIPIYENLISYLAEKK